MNVASEQLDKDLWVVQSVRNLIRKAKAAQAVLATFDQKQMDRIVEAMANAGLAHAEQLGRHAQEETGFGRAEDKKIKNIFASQNVYESIRDMKTIGIISESSTTKIMEVGVPMGVIAALIPSTNPTSTVIYKALIALKAGNAIVFSPHPGAKKCIRETVDIIKKAAIGAGCPEGAISAIEVLSLESTETLMKHPDIALILATGGSAMVKAAYSSGNPAIGVGPGNGPSFIEKTADIPLAVTRILDSKTFDYGTICSSEQSIVVEACIKDKAIEELKKQGAYFLNDEEKRRLSKFILRSNGTMNPQIVGKSPQKIGELAGISIPPDIRVIVGIETEVGDHAPFSREKLCPILGFYVEENWEKACVRSMEILNHEGAGHTMSIHSKDESIIREFALKKPVNRLLVNTPAALGGIGATTELAPALTLGCGAVGGSSTSDNITPLHLMNIRRVAYGATELEAIKGKANNNLVQQPSASSDTEALIQAIVEKVMKEIKM